MAQPNHTLPQGHTINEYRIDKVLGIGGFGLTYLATDTNLSLQVALKEYLPAELAVRDADGQIRAASENDRPTFDWGLARFLDEARTLATFRHSNIVRVMRFFQANQTAYMVMEFVEGAQLSDWVKTNRPVSQQALLSIIRPLAEGLGVIHAAGYLHRDVKPGNIYMRQDGSPVLLDFGAARAQKTNSEMTAVVSPGYAPVEQYSESSDQGPWSDLYALGGVMYWLVTGNKPVDATARIRHDPQVPARTLGSRTLYDENLLAAIDWALDPDDRKRPRTTDTFLQSLPSAGNTAASVTTRVVPLAADATRTLPLGLHNSAPPTLLPASDATLIASGFDISNLQEIETALAGMIGPLAGVLMRKTAKKVTTMEALIELLAREIDDETDRATFVRRAKRAGLSQPPSQPRSGGSQPSTQLTKLALERFDPSVLERAERRLAQHIGAVAKVIVKKAAAKARDEGELYIILADEIEDRDDRKAFVRKAITASGRTV